MKEKNSPKFFSLSVVFLTIVFLAAVSFAQVTTGNLQGTVTDQTGALIPGARVTLENTETGQIREAVANDDGFYRFTSLLPGEKYKITVESANFTSTTVENVVVRIGSENVANVALSVGGQQVQVDVRADPGIIDSAQSQLSKSYNSKQLTQLPINGGAIETFALLTPGVVTPGDADFSNGVGISANGNRGRSNNFQIDGQDNNDNSVAGPSLSITNTEAIGEVQVITGSPSAEFGRNSGAQINAVTKSGTNEFHGSLFEYHQNSRLDARTNVSKREQANFKFLADNGFSQLEGLAKRDEDPYRDNRFGGSIGGPIIKNRAFFFATYQGDYFGGESAYSGLGGGALTFTPESATLAAKLFPNAATAALTSTAIAGGPAFSQVGQAYVLPSVLDTNGDGIVDDFAYTNANGGHYSEGLYVLNNGVVTPLLFGEVVRVVPTVSKSDQLILKTDFSLSNKDNMSIRYIYDKGRNPLATGRFTAGAIFDVPSSNNNLGATYTRQLSANYTNEARFTFSRLDVSFGDINERPGPSIGFSGTRNLNSDGSLTFGTQNTIPQSRKVDVYQFQDTLISTVGNHSLKYGADIRFQNVANFFLPNFLGVYTFSGSNPFRAPTSTSGAIPAGTPFVFDDGSSRTGYAATAFENFLLGRPRQVNFALGDPAITTKQQDYFFFIQDDWKARKNLTLNLGLRYELSTSPFNPIIEKVNAREADASAAIFNTAFPLETRTAAKIPLDKNNFAPRLGFAWSPSTRFLGKFFDNKQTVIRGSFAVSYDPSFFNIVLNTVTAAPYAAAGTFIQTPGAAGSQSFPFLPSTTAQLNLTPGTNGGDPRLFSQTRVDPNFYSPYSLGWGLGIQQELGKKTVLEVRYAGNRSIGQFQTINGNPNVSYLNNAAQCLGLDPGTFSNGLVVGSPAASVASACVNGGFSNRPGTNSNGRLDSAYGATRLRTNGASSIYHALQSRLDFRFTNSFNMTANYTFSKNIDNASEIFSTGGGGQSVADPQRFFDSTTGERGLSAFHQKHAFVSDFNYEFPFFKSQKGFVGKLLGGFQLTGIIRAGSGRPYTPVQVYGTYDPGFENSLIGLGALRPFNGNPSAPNSTIAFGYQAACSVLFGGPYCDYNGGTLAPGGFVVFDTMKSGSTGTVVAGAAEAAQQARVIYNDFGLSNQFGIPLSSLEAFRYFKTPYGNIGRNTFIGNMFSSVNLNLMKTTNITEKYKLEFRLEAQNVLNHRNFGVPDAYTEDAATSFTVSTYQNPGAFSGGARALRFGLRFLF